jgi:peptidyl-prolyl cis-trans isomerase D
MALSGMRKGAGTPLGKVLMGIVALTFVVGIGSSGFLNTADRAVAVVGGEEIKTDEYRLEYERTLQRLSQERGQRVSVTQAKQEQIPQGVLAGMITRQAVQNHAASIGVTTSDREAVKQIQSIEAFSGILGAFDETTFGTVLQQSGFTVSGFEKMVRGDITQEQMINAVTSGMTLPRTMAEAIVSNRLERRNASYIVLAPDLAGRIEAPSEEVLTIYYEANLFDYTRDELRDVSFLSLGAEDFTADVAIPEEEIQDVYERRTARYTTEETRNIERLFGSREDMIAARARIESGESFVAVGLSMGLDEATVVPGDINKRGITDTAVAAAVFAAEEPGLLGPIEGLSWSLVRLNAITPVTVTPLDSVRAEIRDELIQREATRSLGDNIDLIDEAIASGEPLEEIAKKIGLTLQAVKKVSATGTLENGDKATSLPDDPSFLKEVYASIKNFDSDLIEFGTDHFFVVRVDEIYASAPRPFETVKRDVNSAWLEAERGNRLSTLASSIIERAEAGEDFAALGDEVGRGVLDVPGGLGRGQTTALFSADLVGQLFQAKEGDFVFSSVDIGESLVVMRTGSVVSAPGTEIGTYVDVMKEQLDASFEGDAERQYLNAVQALYPSKQNPKAIALAIGDAPQS